MIDVNDHQSYFVREDALFGFVRLSDYGNSVTANASGVEHGVTLEARHKSLTRTTECWLQVV